MEDYEREWEEIQNKTDKWLESFLESKYFDSLGEVEKGNSGFAIGVFVDYMFDYEGQGPDEWDIYSLETCCLDILPRKVTADEDFSKVLPKILEAYFLYLEENKLINNGKALARKVMELKPRIIEKFDDPSNWGMAKSFMMGAVDNGVDISNESNLTRYMAAYNMNLAENINIAGYTPKTGRNEPCRCGSGKKYKKCCG